MLSPSLVRIRWLVCCAVASYLCCTATVRGDRGGGIGADVALDQAVRAIEAETEHKSALTDTLLALDERERTVQASLRDHVRALYRITRSGSSPVAGGFDAVRSHLSRVRRLKNMVQRDLSLLATTRKDQASAQQAAKQSDQALASAQQRLSELRTQQANTPRPAEREASTSDHGFYGLRLSSGRNVSAFESLRGKLNTPISGELRLRDIQRGRATAVLFEAPAGTTVRAAAPGRVVVSDAGTVIVDHGDGYHTAYGNLGNVDVRVGDDVSGQARLGSIADQDDDEPALLFEVRKGSRSVPPRPWLGL